VKAGKVTNALYEAINAVKPAGLLYEIVEESGVWLQGEKRWNEIPSGTNWNSIVESEY
jgi:hypothetical protein